MATRRIKRSDLNGYWMDGKPVQIEKKELKITPPAMRPLLSGLTSRSSRLFHSIPLSGARVRVNPVDLDFSALERRIAESMEGFTLYGNAAADALAFSAISSELGRATEEMARRVARGLNVERGILYGEHEYVMRRQAQIAGMRVIEIDSLPADAVRILGGGRHREMMQEYIVRDMEVTAALRGALTAASTAALQESRPSRKPNRKKYNYYEERAYHGRDPGHPSALLQGLVRKLGE